MNDAWARLRALTPARVAIGRCGDGLPTEALLDFQLAHARARDAVWAELDVATLKAAIDTHLGTQSTLLEVQSQAPDRRAYLQRPDLGRTLCPRARTSLPTPEDWDVAVVVADGLSAPAAHAHAPETLARLLPELAPLRIAPIVLARQARVALGDEVGAALGAQLAVVLLGERPGLSSPDSLGAYLTFAPRPGRQNHERNCVSNIRKAGLPPSLAARRIAALAKAALELRISGVGLKDRSSALAPGDASPILSE